MITTLINRLEESFIALLMAVMTLFTFLQVILRYIFNSGIIWAQEFTIFVFAWLVLFGMSYGVRVGAHIGVDLAVRALPPLGRKIAGFIAVGLCLVYAGLLGWGGWETLDLLLMIGIEAEDVPVPLWVPTLILPVGYALLFIRFLQVAWGLITGRLDGLNLADEAKDAISHLGNVPTTSDDVTPTR